VLCQAESFSPSLAKRSEDRRFGWIGFIVGTLKPEWKNGAWAGGERFSA